MNLYLGTDEGLIVFDGQEEEWQLRYLRLSGHQITAVAAIGRLVLAGTTKGLWRSLDGGVSWRRQSTGQDECHVRALAVHPDSPDTVFLGIEPAAILVSRDSGETWVEAPDVARLRDEHGWSLPYSPAAGCIRGFSLLGPRAYAAAEVGGVLRSDDSGETWKLLKGDINPDVHSITGHTQYPDVVYVVTGGGRYRSRDAGESWKWIGDGYTRAIWTDPDRPEIVLTAPARYVGAMGRVERTIDGGDSWALASDGFRIPMSGMIEQFAGAGSYVLALTTEGTLYTAKRGVWMWHPLELNVPSVRVATFGDF